MSQNQHQNFPRLATSCLLFDSPIFNKILLIERENEPEKGLWTFPGGKLEAKESIKAGMEREVYEETGFRVSIVEDNMFNVVELRDSNYLILTGMAFLNEQIPGIERRRMKDISIKSKYFSLDKNFGDSVWNLKDEECIPGLKAIIERQIKAYKSLHEEKEGIEDIKAKMQNIVLQ